MSKETINSKRIASLRCGLRISEGINLQVSWIDSAFAAAGMRRQGFKDRYIPLPQRTLTLLRRQWLTHRNPVWLFPAGDRKDPHTATVPITTSLRRAF